MSHAAAGGTVVVIVGTAVSAANVTQDMQSSVLRLLVDGWGQAKWGAAISSSKDHIDTRILHSGSKAEYKVDSRNSGCRFAGPLCLVVFWVPSSLMAGRRVNPMAA